MSGRAWGSNRETITSAALPHEKSEIRHNW